MPGASPSGRPQRPAAQVLMPEASLGPREMLREARAWTADERRSFQSAPTIPRRQPRSAPRSKRLSSLCGVLFGLLVVLLLVGRRRRRWLRCRVVRAKPHQLAHRGNDVLTRIALRAVRA